MLSSVELCQSFEMHRNREQKRLELRSVPRKCLYASYYWMPPRMGLLHARLQTCFPVSVQVCLNGREWLARTLQTQGIS